MKTNNYSAHLLTTAHKWSYSKFCQITGMLSSARNLLFVLLRSGLKRSSWILNYIEVTLGGYESFKSKLPLDKYKKPMPWYTFPAIEYIQKLNFSDCDIFEYGSGNSSLYWSSHARTTTSVEFDPNWYQRVSLKLSSNQTLFLKTHMEEYVHAIFIQNKFYDVIVIDGKFRYDCAIEAIKVLKDGGIIILDNSDWFPNTACLIRNNGFSQVDFMGLGPINSYAWCTSLFFRDQLGIPRKLGKDDDDNVLGGRTHIAEDDKQNLNQSVKTGNPIF